MFLLWILLIFLKVSGFNCNIALNASVWNTAVLPCSNPGDNTIIQWLLLDTERNVTKTTYTDGYEVNTLIPFHERLRIIGNASNGDYNLEISNVSLTDTGIYRCTFVRDGKVQAVDINLTVEENEEELDQNQSIEKDVKVQMKHKKSEIKAFEIKITYIIAAVLGSACILPPVIGLAVKCAKRQNIKTPAVMEGSYIFSKAGQSDLSLGPPGPLQRLRDVPSFSQHEYDTCFDPYLRLQNAFQDGDGVQLHVESQGNQLSDRLHHPPVEQLQNPYQQLERPHNDFHVYTPCAVGTISRGTDSCTYVECDTPLNGYMTMLNKKLKGSDTDS